MVLSIRVAARTHYFGAASQPDRRNWMVEILKLRTPAQIITMFEHPKLSKHAMFALLNRCGSKGTTDDDDDGGGGDDSSLKHQFSHASIL